MHTVNMPGFSAASSLLRTSRHYGFSQNADAAFTALSFNGVTPAAPNCTRLNRELRKWHDLNNFYGDLFDSLTRAGLPAAAAAAKRGLEDSMGRHQVLFFIAHDVECLSAE